MTIVDAQARRAASGRPDWSTVEFGHDSTRRGITVMLAARSVREVRMVLDSAFDVAAGPGARRVDDPGWWAAVTCAAAVQRRVLASVQRVPLPGAVHAIVVVERARMVERRPAWPLVRFTADGDWWDLRGERALSEPSDADLAAYAEREGLDVPVSELARMFDLGVLEFVPGDVRGRRGIRAVRP